MKLIAISTSLLGVLLGTAAFASPQHRDNNDGRQGDSRKHEDNKHQREPGNSSAKHSDKHEANGREHQRDQRPYEQGRANHDRPERREPHYQQGHGPEHVREANWHEHDQHSRREVWEGHRAHHWEHEHHSWRERGGYRGYRIPENRFRAHFGRGHWFRVHSVPVVIVAGHPRFQYGGFWFSMVDPWPEYWAPTWYETDDVYVDYVNDGYYMYNRRHPGVAIAINVSL